jgi:BTB/POZ domain
MSRLKDVSFSDNELTFVSSKILQPIAGNDMSFVYFARNTKIDAFYQPGREGSVSLQQLMDIIDNLCERPAKEVNDRHNQNFTSGIKEMWETKNYSDFTITAGGAKTKEFRIHKIILAAQSSVFDAIFMNEMKEKQTGKMTIDDFSADVVEEMLKFIYTGQLKNNSNAMDLFAIASKYDVAKLKDVCEKLILRNIDETNALEIFALGYLNTSDKMKRTAFRTIQQMFPNKELKETEMENIKPEELKELIDTYRELQEMQTKMDSKLKKFTK